MRGVSCSRCAGPLQSPTQQRSNDQALCALDVGGDRQGQGPKTLRKGCGRTSEPLRLFSVFSDLASRRLNASSRPVFAQAMIEEGRILRLHKQPESLLEAPSEEASPLSVFPAFEDLTCRGVRTIEGGNPCRRLFARDVEPIINPAPDTARHAVHRWPLRRHLRRHCIPLRNSLHSLTIRILPRTTGRLSARAKSTTPKPVSCF
jgi:hypothetical protein